MAHPRIIHPENSYNISAKTAALILLNIGIWVRFLFDREGLGSLSIVFLILSIATLFLNNRKIMIGVTSGVFSFLVLLIIIYGYLNAAYRHNEYIFQIIPATRYISYILIAIAVYSLRININSVYKIFLYAILFQILLAVAQRLIFGISRPYGTLINNNHLVYLVGIFFTISLLYYKNYRNSVVSFFSMIFLGGIGGLVSIIAITIYFVALSRINLIYKLIFIIIVYVGATNSSQFDRVNEMTSQEYISRLENNIATGNDRGAGSFGWRVVTWMSFIQELNYRNAFYSGLGIDAASNRSPYFLDVTGGLDPHNDYVRLTVDYGIFVSITYIAILIFSFLYYTASYIFYNRNSSLCLGGIILFISISHMVGNTITQSTLIWFVIAAIVSISLEKPIVRR